MSLEKWLLTVQPSTGEDVESLYMFGDNTWGQIGTEDRTFKSSPVLIGAQSWSQIASGLSHTIGIRSDGKLFAWGANTYGQLGNNDITLVHRSSPVQLGINNWSKVSANGDTSYAINNDGLLFAWGLGFNGQLGNDSMVSSWASNSWTQILAGNTIGIESDGTLWAIGGINQFGNLGLNDQIHRSSPVQIGTSSWTALGGGGTSARFALRNDNLLFVWGGVGSGQAGNNNPTNLSSPVLTGSLTTPQIQQSYTSSIAITQRSWTTVAYGGLGSLFAIRDDGALFGWGLNTFGTLGLNDTARRSSPVQVGTSSWTSVSVNGHTTLALRADSTLWSWGYNNVGQLGENDVIHRSSPVQVGVGTWSKLIQNGGVNTSHIAAIDTNGELWTWGDNTNGQLGSSSTASRSSPVQVGTSSWTMVSAGTGMMAGITTDGALYSWGVNTSGQLGDSTVIAKSSPVQIGTSSWTSVTSASNLTMGITNSGSLYTWGAGTYIGDGRALARSSPVQINSLLTAPITVSYNTYLSSVGNTGISWLSVTGGTAAKMAIRSDGMLFAWGLNSSGSIGDNTIIARSSPVQIGTSSWSMVGTGYGTTIAIKPNGTIWAWGDNAYGQLGLNDLVNRSSPVQIGSDANWVYVSGGRLTTSAIKSDGSLWMWGYNNNGQLGLNDLVHRSSPVQVGTDSWTAISSDTSLFTIAIRNDGGLFTWGGNTAGGLGNNTIIPISSPVQIGTSSWTMIMSSNGAGNGTASAITADNRLFAWGYNNNGQLGLNDLVHRSSPVQVGTDKWVQVSGGGATTYGRRIDGSLWAWGYNGQSELGNNGPQIAGASSPVTIGGANSWNFVGAYTAAVDSNGLLWSWGISSYIGDNQTAASRSSPVFIRAASYDSWTYVSAGDPEYTAIRSDGLLFRWGYNGFGALGGNPGNQALPLQVTTSSWSVVPGGASGSMGINSTGQLFTWGIGTDGQIGDGNMTTISSPVFIRSMNDSWTSIGIGSVNSSHIAGIRYDNTLWMWGLGTSGQLGQNNAISRSQPIQLGKDLLSWTYLSGSSTPVDGTQTAAGIRSDGSLWTWGSNTYGQLGTNNLVHRSSPVQIGSSSWSMVSAGKGFLFAIRSDRTLWSWGSDNSVGALGANTTAVLRSSPVQVGTSLWSMISAGNLTPVGLTINGNLFSWGANTIGQVGDNTVVARSSPVQIGNFVWTSAVAGLDSSSYGIRLDGTLWSWGDNAVGELGEDDTVHRSSPVQIGTGKWKKLAAGFSNAFSIDINNKLWSWGDNSTGQLGVDDTTNRSSPVQIGTSSWLMVSSSQSGDIGSAYVVSAIRSDGALFTWGNNTYGGLGDTTTVNKSSPVQIGTSSWTMVAGRMGIIQDTSNGNGYIYAWGGNTVGELGINSVVDTSSPVQVNATTQTWYQVTQGDAFTIAIRSDKTLWSWGDNSVGQLGDNTVAAALKSSPVQIGTSSWTMVSAGITHTLALDNDNVLYSWGNNTEGQLGTGTASGTIAFPVIVSSLITLADEIAWSTSTGKPRTLSWTKVTAGLSTSFAIRSDSKLFAWGLNTNGQLGLNDILHRSSPVQVGTSNWSGIAAGVSHTYAIRSDGLLFVWGGNASGQLGLSDLVHRSSPVQIGSSSWSFVPSNSTTNATSTFAITLDGKLYGWGLNTNGNIGVNDIISRSSPVQVGTGNSWTLVTANLNSTFAIRTDSKLFAWGLNTAGELGIGNAISRSSPVQLGTSNWNIVATQASGTTAGLMADSTLYTWGSGSGGALGDRTVTARNSPVQIVSFSSPAEQQAYLTKTSKTGYSWSTVVNTNNTMFAIRNDGLLFAWGNNVNGALGLNDILHRSSPVQVGTNSWLTVSAGASFTAAIRSDNTLWTWGVNTAGTIGDGTQAHRSSPVQIGTSTWTAVATGPFNTTGGTVLAVRSDGTLWSWGANDVGQLGLNTVVARSSPVQIGTENTWSTVYSANNRSNAIRTTGALYAWGVNTFGQLGDGTALNRSSPVQIGTSSWTQVASGLSWTVAIRSDGSLFTWGAGTSGVLGTPDSTQHRSSPVQIGTNSWSVVTAGGTVTAGISGNLLYMWGSGANAQFGNNALVNTYYSPTLTTGTSSWTTVNAGSAIAAIDANGQLFTWGTTAGGDGVIGDGVVAGRSSPVFIRSVADSWNAIGTVIAGLSAIRSDGLLFAWGNNTAGSLGDGTTIAKSFPVQIGANSWTMVNGYNNILGITAADTGNALFTWGTGSSGELGILGGAQHRSSPVFIRSMNDSWISVGAGQNMSTAIRSDGKLYVWGLNTFGQLGDSTIISKSYPTQLGNNSNWAVVSAAGSGTVNAITTDGRAYIWGNNTNGQLGLPFNPVTISGSWLEHRSSPVQVGATPYSNSPTQIGASSWSQVSAGVSHVLALTSTNQLFAWGNNGSYQVDNSGSHRSSPVQVGTSSWSQVSAGNVHSLAIASDNSLYGWGMQYQPWVYNPTLTLTNYLLTNDTTTSWTSLTSANNRFAGIRSDGTLWTWGYNIGGELGLNDTIHRSSPVQVGTSSWSMVNSVVSWTTAIRSDGTLWVWGQNTNGDLGLNDLVHRSSPTQLGTANNWVKVGGVGAIRSDGALFTWGIGTSGQLGDNTVLSRSSPVQIGSSSWTTVSSTTRSSLAAISSDGILFTWGLNGAGQLGDNTIANKSSPVQVTSITTLDQQNTYLTKTGTTTFSWSVISTNGLNGTSAAIRNDGMLFTWGDNTAGALGNNTIIHRSSPVQVGTSSWSQVAVGNLTTVAIRTDNTLWAWGSNAIGQLGQNDLVHRSSPVQIGTGSWTMITIGQSSVGAIRSDGTLWTWGSNSNGVLALTDTVHRSSPVQVTSNVGNSSWTMVSINGGSIAGIKLDGTLMTAGLGTIGQLGSAAILSRSSLTAVGASSWTQVAVGHSSMIAIRSDNTLWAWGNGGSGQTGLNDTVNRSSPVQIGTSSWTSVAARLDGAAAIRSDGLLFAWGTNNGTVGDNTVITRSSPVQIGTNTWYKISGLYQAMAAIDNTTKQLFTWGINTSGALGNNSVAQANSPVFIRTANDSWTLVSIDVTTAAIRNDNLLFVWGNDTQGQLGLLSQGVHRSVPTQLGISSWNQVTVGSSYVVGMTSNKLLYTWGDNANGQLGFNDLVHRSSPSLVSTSSWTLVTAGPTTTYGTLDGSILLYAWGQGTNGQVGDNTILSKSSPVQIVSYVSMPKKIGTDAWSKISAGYYHNVGIQTNNKLYGWGNPAANTFTAYSWTKLTASSGHMAAIRSDGALFTWGDGGVGNLGVSDTVHRSSPVQVGTNSWINVAAGGVTPSTDLTTFGITSDNLLYGWGAGATGQLGQVVNVSSMTSPVQISSFSTEAIQQTYLTNTGKTGFSWNSVSVGGFTPSMAAIRSDGRLFTWGTNSQGQLGQNSIINASSPVSVGTNSWTSISVGNQAMYAIRNDNTLWAWGTNTQGQLGLNDILNRSSPVQVGTSSWTQVSGGMDSGNNTIGAAIAIRSDGTLWAWGYNGTGQLGLSDLVHRSSPVQVGTYNSWGAVSSGDLHSTALRLDGTLWSWGYNTMGALGSNNQLHRSSPVQVGTSSWSVISAGSSYTAGITAGRIFSWGNSLLGRLGTNTTAVSVYPSPIQVGALSTWQSVRAGNATTFATTTSNILWVWGSNANGQLGLNDSITFNRSSPVQVGTSSWSTVTAGGSNAAVIGLSINNQLYTWGYGIQGQTGALDAVSRSSPVFIRSTADSWNAISAGAGTTIGIRSDNTLWVWGLGANGQLGDATIISKSAPIQLGTSSWSQVSAGNSYNTALTIDKRLFVWGLGTTGQIGNGTALSRSSPVQIGASWTMVSAGNLTVGAIDSNNLLFTWGGGTNGELGNRTVLSKSSPVQVNSFTSAEIQQTYLTSTGKPAAYSWSMVHISLSSAAAIRSDGLLFMWGLNTNGQLGLNDIISRSSPVQVGASSWTNVGLFTTSTAAIKVDGTLWAWGLNSSGELGLNDLVHRSSPVQVGASSWTAISSSNGIANFLALDAANRLFAWGLNTNGELGLNDRTSRSSPVQIGTTNWLAISSSTTTAAIRTDGALFVWGLNSNGQLGLNDIISRSSPVQVGTNSWSMVSAGVSTTAAITSDGLLYVWGSNNQGQLGLNDVVNRSSPVQVGTNSWISVDAGGSAVGGIRSDNLLFVWGIGSAGQIGDNSAVARSSPVQIGTSSWTMIAVGTLFAAGLDGLGGLHTWGSGVNGELGTNVVTTSSSPVFIPTASDSWTNISTQNGYQLGIRSDGYLFGWGLNTTGQLGLSNVLSRSAPVQIGTYVSPLLFTGNNASEVLMQDADNKLYAWGLNTTGQLGLNDRINKSSPVQIGTNQSYTPPNMYSVPTQIGSSSWTQVSANDDNTFVIDANNVLYEWGFNDNRPLKPTITAVGISAVTVTNGYNHFGITK